MPTYGDFKSAGASHDRARHDAHFAGRDAWLFDLAVVANDWCADAAALAAQAVPVETAHGRPMWIVPGVSCDFAGAAPGRLPDVMRGEETQIAGFLAGEPGFAGTLILPGTHSKHVRLGGGEVQGFATHMTGEVFAALSQHSVLSRTLGTASPS